MKEKRGKTELSGGVHFSGDGGDGWDYIRERRNSDNAVMVILSTTLAILMMRLIIIKIMRTMVMVMTMMMTMIIIAVFTIMLTLAIMQQ